MRPPQLRRIAGDVGGRVHDLLADTLAESLLQWFASDERGRAMPVNKTWACASRRLLALEEAALWNSDAGQDSLTLLNSLKERDEDLADELLDAVYWDPDQRPLPDPLSCHLVSLWEQGFGARCEDSPATKASIVSMIKFLFSRNVEIRALIISPESELPVWEAAIENIREVPCCLYRNGLDQCFPSLIAQLGVHLFTYEQATKHWAAICCRGRWKLLILNDRENYLSSLFKRRPPARLDAETQYLLYEPGCQFTFHAALFHLYFVYLGRFIPSQIPSETNLQQSHLVSPTMSFPRYSARYCYALLRATANCNAWHCELIRKAAMEVFDVSILSAMPDYRLGHAHAGATGRVQLSFAVGQSVMVPIAGNLHAGRVVALWSSVSMPGPYDVRLHNGDVFVVPAESDQGEQLIQALEEQPAADPMADAGDDSEPTLAEAQDELQMLFEEGMLTAEEHSEWSDELSRGW